MRWRGLARSRGTFPPISQRPLRRSTTYQGQEHSPVLRSRPVHRVARGFPAPWLRLSSLPTSRGLPQAGWRRLFPQPVAQSFLSPIDRGFPQAKRLKSFPSPGGSELSSHYATRGFPSAAQLEVFPSPTAQSFLRRTRLGVSPPPHTLKFSLRRWLKVPPCGFPFCRVAPDFPETRGPEVCPIPGGPGFPPHRWLGVSSLPVALDFSLPESPELSFAGWLGVSPSPVTVPGGEEISTPIAETAQEVSASNFKILSPSTSHPQLTLGCPPRQTFLHRVLHRTIHRRGPARGRARSAGVGLAERTGGGSAQ